MASLIKSYMLGSYIHYKIPFPPGKSLATILILHALDTSKASKR